MRLTKQITIGCCLSLAAMALAGCGGRSGPGERQAVEITQGGMEGERTDRGGRPEEENTGKQGEGIRARGLDFDYKVDPENFSLTLYVDGQTLPAAASFRRSAEVVKTGEEGMIWRYPDEKIRVAVSPADGYLSVEIDAETGEDQSFRWPDISADLYYIPLGEGKRVIAGQEEWNSYLNGRELAVNESLSMPFWASVYGDYAVLFIMENPFRTNLVFSGDSGVAFSAEHEYPAIAKNRTNRYRVYVAENDPVAIAKIYRAYAQEKGEFVTLEQKAAKNPDVRKLYGAPHIYLHGELAVSPDDINWPAFRNALDTPEMRRITSFFSEAENGAETKAVFDELAKQDYVAEYQKNVICTYLTSVIKRRDFYTPGVFSRSSAEMQDILDSGEKTPYRVIRLNQGALAENMPEVFQPADSWLAGDTTELLAQLEAAGIREAWIGLNSWEQAYIKPEMVRQAEEQGYLIGAYDSYHSIHEPGKEQWITAKFSDSTLYENATIAGADGEKLKGFKQVGRKLNPTLSMPAVKSRMEEIMDTEIPFNSWFIDCDAFGEIYDDYSPEHITTQEEDLAARLERMAYIRDNFGLVIGSEGGNGFAASTVAFAHGIELKSFAWMDEDMNANRDSPYYMGKYYNARGGVPEHFSKRVPLKEPYRTVFLDPRCDIPLFKLVYNDSVITSYHWDWSTFKIQGATADRMLREVLYNVPPLYHLDRAEWERYGKDIARHNAVWSEFSKKACEREMTDFASLSGDGAVQMAGYGPDLKAVANFSASPWQYGDMEIPAHSVLIEEAGRSFVYTPDVEEENR